MSKRKVLLHVRQHIAVHGGTDHIRLLTSPLVTEVLNILDLFLISRENGSRFLL